MSNYELSPDNLVNHPRPEIDKKWQKQLAHIGGANDYGEPKLKLEWAPDIERIAYGEKRKHFLAIRVKRMIWWLETRANGTKKKHPPDKIAPNVPITSILAPVYETYDVSKQRWVVMEWWPPELVCPGWEDSRYEWINGLRVDVMGPEPIRGMYRPVMMLENADGTYREPDDAVMLEIKQLAWMRQAEPQKYGAREAQNYSEDIRKEAEKLGEHQVKKDKETDDNFEERIRENLAPHVHKLIKNHKAVW